ncbi:MFS transporter [Moorella naiadis]|uniref:MFS transporter n=1 Tax=Moorella naiadis (nom. illeg.) TaxID=3093670 RepID=UPI003D9C98D0
MLARTKENYKWYALSCTTLGALLSVLNSNTLLIALPAIARSLHASMETIIWTLMIYMLAVTVLVPAIGRVADIIGRKKLYVSGFALFTLASLLCGLVQTGGQLVAARFIQAVGGSLMLANSTAIVTDVFPRQQLGRALGINSMVIGAGAVIGPILGGILTAWHWRWVFFFNVPLGIIGTIWAAIQLREIIELPKGQRFDWLGTTIFTIGFTLILLALTFGDMVGWHTTWIVASLVLGSLLMVLFIYIENRVDQPMLDLSLFRRRLLAAAYTSNLLNGIARGAVTFLLIFFFQGIWGIDPLWAGILLTPFALAMMIVAPVSGILSDRYGSRELSSLGLAVSAIGLYGLTRLQVNTSMAVVITWMVVMGLGSGFFFSPNTNAIMGAVSAERRGIAAGTRTMMNNAGMVISIALGLAMTAASMTPAAMQGLFAGTQVGSQGIVIQEFINGLHRAFWLSFIISIVAAIVALMRGHHEVYCRGIGSGSNKA